MRQSESINAPPVEAAVNDAVDVLLASSAKGEIRA